MPEKITKRIVDALAPGAFVWDTQVQGFGCRCLPSGRKVYLLKHRLGAGGRRARQRWLTLGTHGAPLTAELARAAALENLAAIKKGADPVGERLNERVAETMDELCDAYVQAVERGAVLTRRRLAKKASTLATDKGRIERHIKPLLGRHRVRDITKRDIEQFLSDVREGKTRLDLKTGLRGRAIVEGGAGTASRTVGLLGGIFTFAVNRGLRPDNPVRGVVRPADQHRDRFLAPEEYRALGKVLEGVEGDDPVVVACIRFLLLTGARKGEALGLEWSHVDERARCLRLPDTKTGASLRPLSRNALSALGASLRIEGNPLVFPGRSDSRPMTGLPKRFARMCAQAKLARVTLHTLRHSFATVANELGLAEATIAALLGHKLHTITGRYTHHLDSTLLAAADRVANAIADRLAGQSTQGNVVDLPRRAG